mmetsp:Transcript_42017/g.94455  ORF Transcript_42017/g.94455 Transcript_42017/m.94455 type:complete len:99 (-) Transcript_42017:397-693(-)
MPTVTERAMRTGRRMAVGRVESTRTTTRITGMTGIINMTATTANTRSTEMHIRMGTRMVIKMATNITITIVIRMAPSLGEEAAKTDRILCSAPSPNLL